MDHLPLPNNPLLKHFDIPFFCTENYDGGDFKTYPERNGWTVKTYTWTCIFTQNGQVVEDEQQIGSFLQTWLYFGLFFDTIGEIIDVQSFRRLCECGDYVLNTALLEETCTPWCVHEESASNNITEEQRLARKDRWGASFASVGDLVQGIVISQRDRLYSPLTLICLGIAVLGEYLTHTIVRIAKADNLKTPIWRMLNTEPASFDPARCLLDIMHKNGWCPRALAHIERSTHALSTLWFFANLEPPHAQDSHRSCVPQACSSLQVELGSYTTVHVENECKCDFMGPVAQDLARIVLDGDIPLVSVRRASPGDSLTMNIQRYDGSMEFVAISHVWADGHGNLEDNTLPACVLLDIQACVNALLDSGVKTDFANGTPFWMDTLCLPRKPRWLRREGILKLSEPFKRATKTLVLDSYLRKFNLDDMYYTETIAKVSISDWTQRLWTFCEGMLAVSAHIQFRDRAVDVFRELETWLSKYPYLRLAAPHFVHSEVVGTYRETKFLAFSNEVQFETLRQSLRTRATSWQYDEPICLAIILGLDMKQIVQAPDREKMRVFWQLMEKLPGLLAFSRSSHKLSQKGFRWAPASLIGDFSWTASPALSSLPDARLCADGLVVPLKGYQFQACSSSSSAPTPKINFMACFRSWNEQSPLSLSLLGLQDNHGNWYLCQIGEKWNQDSYTWTSIQQQPVILLSGPTLLHVPNLEAQLQLHRALFATYDPSQMMQDPIRVTIHNHFNLSSCIAVENQWRNELRRCADALLNQHCDEIESMMVNVHELRDLVSTFVDEYENKSQILELGRMSNPAYLGSDFDLDIHVEVVSCEIVLYLLMVGDWYIVEEMPKPLNWCVD